MYFYVERRCSSFLSIALLLYLLSAHQMLAMNGEEQPISLNHVQFYNIPIYLHFFSTLSGGLMSPWSKDGEKNAD